MKMPDASGPRFTVGDKVVLKTGECPQIVVDVKANPYGKFFVRCIYLARIAAVRKKNKWHEQTDYGAAVRISAVFGARNYEKFRPEDDFVPYVEPKHKEGREMAKDLYQTKKEPIEYGTFLVKNSKGEMVLEMKGTGGVVAFRPEEIEKVMPYTVSV